MKAFLFGLLLAAALLTQRANALVVYTDQAQWLAAMQGLTVGQYQGQVTRTDYLTTIVTTASPPGTAFVSSQTATSQTDFKNFFVNFSFSSACQFAPGCQITAPLQTTLDFSESIMGFAATANFGFGHTSLNGTEYFVPTNQFFGVVGPLSQLDFRSLDGFTDNPVTMRLSDILVATASDVVSAVVVPEPATLAILGMALVTLIGVSRFRRV